MVRLELMGWFPDVGLWRLLPIPVVLYALVKWIQGSYKRHSPPRWAKIPPSSERVLVLGASSGVGRVIALAYARRGAAVCVVGRRAEMLNAVKEECLKEYSQVDSELRTMSTEEESLREDGKRCLAVAADCSDSQDMMRVYEAVDSGRCTSSTFFYHWNLLSVLASWPFGYSVGTLGHHHHHCGRLERAPVHFHCESAK